MPTLLPTHGEKFTKQFPVEAGKKVFYKQMQFCARCGEVDLFLFPEFDRNHGAHAPKQTNETHYCLPEMQQSINS